MYVPLTNSPVKSIGIPVSNFFSMLPSTLKYLYSVKPVRMHFPAKQPSTNVTVCNAARVTVCCNVLKPILSVFQRDKRDRCFYIFCVVIYDAFIREVSFVFGN